MNEKETLKRITEIVNELKLLKDSLKFKYVDDEIGTYYGIDNAINMLNQTEDICKNSAALINEEL